MIKSSVVTASGVVENVSGTLHTVNITKVATGSGSVKIYDNATTNSGNVLFQGDGLAAMSYPLGNFAGGGVGYTQGLYIELAGSTNATVVVTYE
jgi:hypothetical protein